MVKRSHNILVLSMMVSTVVMPHSWWVVTTSMYLSWTIPLTLYYTVKHVFQDKYEVHLHNPHAWLWPGSKTVELHHITDMANQDTLIIKKLMIAYKVSTVHSSVVPRPVWVWVRDTKYTAGSTVLWTIIALCIAPVHPLSIKRKMDPNHTSRYLRFHMKDWVFQHISYYCTCGIYSWNSQEIIWKYIHTNRNKFK